MSNLKKEIKNLNLELETDEDILPKQNGFFYRFKKSVSGLVIASMIMNMMMPAITYPFKLNEVLSDSGLSQILDNLDENKLEEIIFKLLGVEAASAQAYLPEFGGMTGSIQPGSSMDAKNYWEKAFGLDSVKVFDKTTKTAVKAVGTLAKALDTKRRTEELTDQSLKNVAWVALKQSLHTMLNTFAYDVATWIATGAAGEKPMFYDVNWGEYMTGLIDSAAGDFVDRLSEDWLGFSVCNPSGNLKVRIGLGIAETRRPKQPDCTVSKMINNWDSFINDSDFLEKFDVAFDASENDLGIAISMFGKSNEMVESNWWRGILQRIGDDESKGVVSKISEKIFTPSFLVSEQGKELLKSAKDADYEKVQFGDIMLDAVSTFINTLAGKLFEELFKKGLAAVYGKGDSESDSSDRFSLPDLPGFNFGSTGENEIYTGDTGLGFYGGRQGAQSRFIDFLNAGISEVGQYDILTKFTSCPDSANPGPDECVILSGFRQAIEKEITLSQAIESGYIAGDKPFGSMQFNGQESLRSGFPYRSLLILRSHRVIPVTWEIAAAAINKFEKGGSRSLNELIGSFNDKSSIYYGLIDPDWVLKLPEHYCKAQGYGEKILYEEVTEGIDNNADGDFNDDSDVPPIRMVGRSQYCADFQSCLKETEDGACMWGYCVEERRIWDLDASSCPKEFNTCQTFQGRSGNVFSALQNTLDFNGCNINNVGCRWYCQHYNPISKVWDCTSESERTLNVCVESTVDSNGVAGCAVAANCDINEGQNRCFDQGNGIEVKISEPCSSSSKWWNTATEKCSILSSEAACTIPRSGIQCYTSGCEKFDNLLSNPSFEVPPQPRIPGVLTFDIAQNWKINEAYINYFILAGGDREQVYDGSNSLRFYNSGTNVTAEINSDGINLVPGKQYTFSGKIYNNLVSGKATITINGTSKEITERKEGWQSLDFEFLGAINTSINIQIGGTISSGGQVAGSIWFDNFKITESCSVNPIKLTLIGTMETDQSKLHLDRNASECPSDKAGCSEFIRTKVGLGTNLYRNSSFEIWPEGQLFPPGMTYGDQWETSNRIEKIYSGLEGSLSVKLINGGAVGKEHDFQSESIIGMKPNTAYRISLWAKSDEKVDSKWSVGVLYKRSNGSINHDDLTINDKKELSLNSNWQHYIFNAYGTDIGGSEFKISFNNASTDPNVPIYLDAIQIEEVPSSNSYFSEYKDYGKVNLSYIKKAPESLGCKGYTKERPSPYVIDGIVAKEQCQGENLVWKKACLGGENNGKNCNSISDCPSGSCVPRGCEGDKCCHEIDPAECYSYSPYCFADEVGCNSYNPTEGNISIQSVVARDDYCPAECIGYDSYKQSATYFESKEALDFFIPSTAVSCTAADAGCDEFTNLDEISQGGEAKEYYKYLRLCKKPQDADAYCKTFYAWQGSSETGYQLKTYVLSTANALSNEPKSTITDLEDWPSEWCSDKTLDANGLPNCCNGPDDLEKNPFCREFYDINGTIYYKIYQNTISCSDNCHPFRKTRLGENDSDAETNCKASNGSWDSANLVCIYQAIPGQGIACSSRAIGCREYRGNAGANIFTAFFEDFESGTESGWKIGQIQSEALSIAGHSIMSQSLKLKTSIGVLTDSAGNPINCNDLTLRSCDANNPQDYNCYDRAANACKAKDSDRSDICLVQVGEQYCSVLGNTIKPKKTYLISFWAKSASANIVQDLEIKFINNNDVSDVLTPQKINIQPDWDYYLFGPYKAENIIRADGAIDPSIAIDFASRTGEFYVDNLRIQEVKNYVYVNKGTWATPQSCDQNPFVENGPIRAPQFMLGCKQYLDISNLVHNLRSFNKLCREIAVGCEAMIDTNNSTSPFSETFNQNDIYDNGTDYTTDDDVDFSLTVPQDKLVYIVNRLAYQCEQPYKGCQILGLPLININNEVVGYNTVSKINNPDDYANSLCRNSEVSCEEFSSGNKFSYFKSPGQKTCEYRQIPNQSKFAWYKTGSISVNPDCPIKQPPLGTVHPKSGWVGLCPEQYNNCTQFVDSATKFGKNLIFNYDFGMDIDRDTGGIPDGWYQEAAAANVELFQKIKVQQGKLYIFGVTSNADPATVDPLLGYSPNPLLKDTDFKFEIRGCESISSFDHSLIEEKNCADKTTGNLVLPKAACQNDSDCGSNRCAKILAMPPEVYQNDDRTNETISGLRGEREYTGRFFSPFDQYCEIRIIASPEADFIAKVRKNLNKVSAREALVNYALSDTVDKMSCNGVADEKAGCVLFNDRSYVNYRLGEDDISYLAFDADISGRSSGNELINNGLPVMESNTSAYRVDSNIVLKTKPDRECEAWIYPNSFTNFSEEKVERNFSTSIITCNSMESDGSCSGFAFNNNKLGTCRIDSSTPPVSSCINDSDCSAGFKCFRQSYDYYNNPEQVKNLSGFSKPGYYFAKGGVCTAGQAAGASCIDDFQCALVAGSCDKFVFGYYPFSEMKQLGGLTISQSTDFEAGILKPYGWILDDLLPLNSEPPDFSKAEWKPGYAMLINNPVSAQQQGIDPFAPSGRAFVRVSGPFRIKSEEIEAFSSTEYFISGYLNTVNLAEGSGLISIRELDGDGNKIGSDKPLLRLQKGNGWSLLTNNFITESATARLEVILSNWNDNGGLHDGVSGDTYFDDVKIRPVLKAAGLEFDDTYIVPSCRIYPASDSLSCDYYTDKNYRLRGWLGYCLQPDPANASQCLLWWPVDLIEGGYAPEQPSNIPSPLYYCLGAVEDLYYLNKCLFENGELCSSVNSRPNSSETLPRIFSWEVPQDWKIQDWQIQNISAGAMIVDCNPPESGAPYCQTQTAYSRLVFNRHPLEENAWVNRDGIKAKLNYSSQGLLESIDFEVLGANCVCNNIDITFVIKNIWCRYLVQTVTLFGQNKAWFNRISEEGAKRFVIPGLGYLESADYLLFGSAVPPEPAGEPEAWNLSDDSWIRPLLVARPYFEMFEAPYQARAGTPYACVQGSAAFWGKPCSYPGESGVTNIIAWSQNSDNSKDPLEHFINYYGKESLMRLFARTYGSWEFQGYGVCRPDPSLETPPVPIEAICACPESECAKLDKDITYKACGKGICSYFDEGGRLIPDSSDEALVPDNIVKCETDQECLDSRSCENNVCKGTLGVGCTTHLDCPISFCIPTGQSCEVDLWDCISLKQLISDAATMVIQTFYTDSYLTIELVIVLIVVKLIGMILLSCGPKSCSNSSGCDIGEGTCISFISYLLLNWGISDSDDPNGLDWVINSLIAPILGTMTGDASDGSGNVIQNILNLIGLGESNETLFESDVGIFAFIGDIFGEQLGTVLGSVCSNTPFRCSGGKKQRCCWWSNCNPFTTSQSRCEAGPFAGKICSTASVDESGDQCPEDYICELKSETSSYIDVSGFDWKEPISSCPNNVRPLGYCEGGIYDKLPCFNNESCIGFKGKCDENQICVTSEVNKYIPQIASFDTVCSNGAYAIWVQNICKYDLGEFDETAEFIMSSRPFVRLEVCSGDSTMSCTSDAQCIDGHGVSHGFCVLVATSPLPTIDGETCTGQMPGSANAGYVGEIKNVPLKLCSNNKSKTCDNSSDCDGNSCDFIKDLRLCVIEEQHYLLYKENTTDILCTDQNVTDLKNCKDLPGYNPCNEGDSWDNNKYCYKDSVLPVISADCNAGSPGKVCYSETSCSISGGDYCAVYPTITYFSVNGKEGSSIQIYGTGSIVLNFTAEIDEAQLPMTGYAINWGDDTKSSVSGQLLAVHSSKENPFKATHFYSYWDLLALDQAGKLYCGQAPGDKCCKPEESVCVVVPMVRVTDNWGWCSGGQHGSACQSSWTRFGGQIVVMP